MNLDAIFFALIPLALIGYLVLLFLPGGSLLGRDLDADVSDWRAHENALEQEESSNDLGKLGDP